jgi:hypothetical protein
VSTPVIMGRPFEAQTPFGIALAYELRAKAVPVTVAALVLTLVLLAYLSRHVTRWWQWPAIVLLAAVGGFSTWFARQNVVEWMFNPLRDPTYAPAALARFVADDDMVIAVEIAHDAVAWPVREMGYHHVVEATVGGRPVVSTY